jgi:hypothetical protein
MQPTPIHFILQHYVATLVCDGCLLFAIAVLATPRAQHGHACRRLPLMQGAVQHSSQGSDGHCSPASQGAVVLMIHGCHGCVCILRLARTLAGRTTNST